MCLSFNLFLICITLLYLDQASLTSWCCNAEDESHGVVVRCDVMECFISPVLHVSHPGQIAMLVTLVTVSPGNVAVVLWSVVDYRFVIILSVSPNC